MHIYGKSAARLGTIIISAIVLSACGGTNLTSPGGVTPLRVKPNAIHRPISDFVNAQAKYPGLYNYWLATRSSLPGCPGGASGTLDPAGFVDFSGYWTAYLAGKGISLGTTFGGTVQQSDNGDGTSTVKVQLNTKNALSWAACYDVSTNSLAPFYLGYDGTQVGSSSPAALGSSQLSVVFTIVGTGPSAPLPSMTSIGAICPAPAPCYESLKFTATASGLLNSGYGSLAGSPGKMSIEQIGTFHINGRAGNDGFTAEFVKVHPGK